MAHGLAEILAYQAGSGAQGRRTETAQPGCVAQCGNCDRRDDEESALLPRARGADGSPLCVQHAADNLHESLEHVRIHRLLPTPGADATPTTQSPATKPDRAHR
jgi:hypothetical protein